MRTDKEIFFKTATLQLLSQIDDMHIINSGTVKKLVLCIRKAFMDEQIRNFVFGRDLAKDMSSYAANGFCAAACILFLNVIGDKDWKLMYIDDMWTYGPHYFLIHKPSNKVLDLTFDQFAQENIKSIPYDMGRPVKITKYSADQASRFAKAIKI